jgi:hypothetical protein
MAKTGFVTETPDELVGIIRAKKTKLRLRRLSNKH